MPKLPTIVLILTLYSCKAYQIPEEERVDVQCYSIAADFVRKDVSKVHYTKIRKETKGYIVIGTMFEHETNARVVEPVKWAIRINGSNYISLRYSKQLSLNVHARFDVEGGICAMVLDDDTPKEMLAGSNAQYGLVGLMADESNKSSRNWASSKYPKNQILIVDISKNEVIASKNYKGPITKFLTKQNLNSLLGTDFSKEKIERMGVEEVLALIKKLNQKN